MVIQKIKKNRNKCFSVSQTCQVCYYLINNSNIVSHCRPYWTMLGMSEVLEQVAAVSEQLVQYNLHNDELLLLQATVLANAGRHCLLPKSNARNLISGIFYYLYDVQLEWQSQVMWQIFTLSNRHWRKCWPVIGLGLRFSVLGQRIPTVVFSWKQNGHCHKK